MGVEIIKNAVPDNLCLAAEAAWPSPDWPYWYRYQGVSANKFASMDRSRIPPACLAALDALALAVIPYIGDSFIDYDLHASGMHMLPPGGFLSRHQDAESHPLRQWKRTYSIVLNVNYIWTDRWGGQLQLEQDNSPEIQITPVSGQVVIFSTEKQWHEVLPVDDDCPEYRKTLALFAWKYDAARINTSATFKKKGEVNAP